MAPSRNRTLRTQGEQDDEARALWDRLFVEEDQRQRTLARIPISSDNDNDSDDDLVTPSPIYDDALNVQGPDRVLRMCNFSPIEFERLWECVEDYVLAHWNIGRGKKCTHSPKDVLFMTLGALKHCGSWDTVSAMFNLDSSAFQKMVKKYLIMLEPYVYESFVLGEEKRWTMKEFTVSGNTFDNFPSARYATDVTFQQADKPNGGFINSKQYFSGKHNLYGLKVEVSVLPNGLAINCTDFEPGAVADITIFRQNKEFHRLAMQKLQGEERINDEGPLLDRFAQDWAVLVDKGYQGVVREFRAFQPKKKARGAPPLTLSDREENDRISHDRVIVENFFGRLKTLWGVCSHKWKWDRVHYNLFFRVCVAITNYSVRYCPLRRDDGEAFQRYETRLRQMGVDHEAREKRKRQSYRDNRRSRLELSSRTTTRTRTSPIQHTPVRRRRSIDTRRNTSPCSTEWGTP